jgi:hypothetical protein
MNSNQDGTNIGLMKVSSNILFYWGLITTVLILIGMFSGEKPDSGYGNLLLGTFFIGILPMGIGYYLKQKVKKKLAGKDAIHEKKKIAAMEKKVINAAIKHKGILTLTQASLSTNVNLDDTKSFMETMVSKGYCNLDFNEDGIIEYRFPEFIED